MTKTIRGLYICNLDLAKSVGYAAKIRGQAEGFSKCGYDMDLIAFDSADAIWLTRYQANQPYQAPRSYLLSEIGGNFVIRRRRLLQISLKHIQDTSPQFIYLRYPRSEPLYLCFLSKLKKERPHLIVCSEFPTYPYDREYQGSANLKDNLVFSLDKLTRNYLKHFIDRIVSINYESSILDIPTISIDNGINVDALSRMTYAKSSVSSAINMIGVANVRSWHGYDRVLKGLGQYYRQEEKPYAIRFHIVGATAPYKKELQRLVKEESISHAVIFHEPTRGQTLDSLFSGCHLAVGVLGGHRKGLKTMSPLKNREYCARSIPFFLVTLIQTFQRISNIACR